jgi:hypothetical protein
VANETARREAGAALVEALDVLSAALPRAVELARTEERAAERAAVVAYLRDCALVSAQLDAPLAATNFQSAASAIERGEPRREEAQ